MESTIIAAILILIGIWKSTREILFTLIGCWWEMMNE